MKLSSRNTPESAPNRHNGDENWHAPNVETGTEIKIAKDWTRQLKRSLPRGMTVGRWKDGRSAAFFVRYGNPRKTESFYSEASRNKHAEDLAKAEREMGNSVLNYDPQEWGAFQAWKKMTNRHVPTVEKAVETYLSMRLKEDIREKSDTHLHIKTHLTRFAAYFAGRRLDHILTDDIRGWLESLTHKNKPVSDVTRKHHRMNVNTFLKRAVAEKWIIENPCLAIVPPRVEVVEREPLKPNDVFRLLKANLARPVAGRLALELFGGLRSSSAGRLHKEHLNFESKGITLPGAIHKSGKRKYRQGHQPVLWSWLNHVDAECWEISPRNYDQLKFLAFHDAGWRNVPHNILRHSFVSYMLALTKSISIVAYLAQHRNTATTEIYEGVADENDARLIFAMTPEALSKVDTYPEFLAQQKHEHETSGTVRPDPSGSGESERGRNQVNGAQGAS